MTRSKTGQRGEEDQETAEPGEPGPGGARPSGVRKRPSSRVTALAAALDALEVKEPSKTIEDIVRRYKPFIWLRVARPTIPEEDAEELLVEVILTMNKQIEKRRRVPERPGRTLNTIITHAICNYVRSQKRALQLVPNANVEREPAPSSRSSPDKALHRARRARFARKILEMMDRNDRELLELVYFCGNSEVDLAEEMNLSKEALRSRVHEARGRFRKLALRHKAELGGDL